VTRSKGERLFRAAGDDHLPREPAPVTARERIVGGPDHISAPAIGLDCSGRNP
jgi:hypothetical protein